MDCELQLAAFQMRWRQTAYHCSCNISYNYTDHDTRRPFCCCPITFP